LELVFGGRAGGGKELAGEEEECDEGLRGEERRREIGGLVGGLIHI